METIISNILPSAINFPGPSAQCCTATSFLHNFLWTKQSSCSFLLKTLQEKIGLFTQTLNNSPALNVCYPLERLERNLQDTMKQTTPCIFSDEANLQKYGNKHLNLMKMTSFVDALNLSQGLNIPMPRGISTEQVRIFLQNKAPGVFKKWDELKHLKSRFQGSSPFLSELAPAALLEEIQREIKEAFTSIDTFDNLHLPLETQTWLQEIKKLGGYLMVRSTGAEDSKTLANAGGNVSKAYISAEPKQLGSAIGEVVSSYFGAPSLQNRLNVGMNPFEEPLSLAVTMQELIGEPVGGTSDFTRIPVSFVMFTNEPLYIGKEKFRAMRISATYGHGESVVGNNGIPTDSFLVLQSESDPSQIYYIYDNRRKTERLAPMRDGTEVKLGKIQNPLELQNIPSLNQSQILEMYRFGVLMEKFFHQDATDIEGVILGSKIHFVQARPINRKPMLPTYLDAKSTSNILASIQALPLVAGKASVVRIDNGQHVLIAETLEEAERRYVFGQHQIVVVSKEEPENSHPVVNFSSLGIPCLYTSNLQAVRDLLTRVDVEHPLAVCMQAGTLNLWDSQTAKLENHIAEGFTVHPAKVAISFPISDVQVQQEGLLEIPKEWLLQIRNGEYGLAALDAIEQHPQVLSLRAQAKQSFEEKFLSKPLRDRLAVLQQLEKQLSSAIAQMRAVLQKHPQQRERRLLHAKILETLLAGSKSKGSATLGAYSLKDVAPICRSMTHLIEYQQQFSFPVHCAEMLLDAQATHPEAFAAWKNFLSELEPLIQNEKVAPNEFASFKKTMNLIKEIDALPFLLTFFPKEAIQFESLTSRMTESDTTLIHKALAARNSIEKLQLSIDRFADPNSFAAAEKEYLAIPSLISNSLQDSSPIVRTIVSRLLEEQVTLLDTAVKTLKASDRFDALEKTRLFKRLLQPYYTMMQECAEKLAPTGSIPMHENLSMNDYLSRIQNILQTSPDNNPELLNPSRDFSVSAAMLGAGTAFDRHEPQTLEDLLTLLHQNSLACIHAFNQKLLSFDRIQESLIPQAIKDAMLLIEKRSWGRAVQRIRIEMNAKEIVVRYNVPLSNHSGHLDLHYDINSGQMMLTCQLLGEARDRWPLTAQWIKDLGTAECFEQAEPLSQTAQELTWRWVISPDKLPLALESYAEMAEFSLGTIWQDRLDPLTRFQNNPEVLKKIAKRRFSVIDPEREQFQFYRKYIERGIDLDIATEAAKALVGHSDEDIVTEALSLFNALVAKNQGFAEAIEAAKANSRHSNWVIASDALELFKALVAKDQGFVAAIEAAKANIGHSTEFNASDALELFKALVAKDRGFVAAIEAAKALVGHPDEGIVKEALSLFKALVAKNQGFAEASEAAKALVGHSDKNIGSSDKCVPVAGESFKYRNF